MKPCSKRRYSSERSARKACRNAGFRIAVYLCQHCPGDVFHVTSLEKKFSGAPPEHRPEGYLERVLGPRPHFVVGVEAQQAILDAAVLEAARRRGVSA
jgi:hypothetical protein